MRIGFNSFNLYNNSQDLVKSDFESNQKSQRQTYNPAFGTSRTWAITKGILSLLAIIGSIPLGIFGAGELNKKSAENSMKEYQSLVTPQKFQKAQAKLNKILGKNKDSLNQIKVRFWREKLGQMNEPAVQASPKNIDTNIRKVLVIEKEKSSMKGRIKPLGGKVKQFLRNKKI